MNGPLTPTNHQVCSRHALLTVSQSTRKQCYESTGPRRQDSKIVSLLTLFLLSEHRERWWPIVITENSKQNWKSNFLFWWLIVLKANSKQKWKSNVFNLILLYFYFYFLIYFTFIIFLICFIFLIFLWFKLNF